MFTYEQFAVEALRLTLIRPYGYTDLHDKKYGIPPPDQNFDRYDPSQPAHPLWNRPPDPEPTFQDYLDQRERAERKKFAEVWEEAIRWIKRKRFKTRTELAAHFSQKPHWACELVRLIVKHHRISAAEMRECLPGRTEKSHRLKPSGGALSKGALSSCDARTSSRSSATETLS
jgi:hypothetical protein